VLGVGVVDVHGGEGQNPVFEHGTKTNNACGGFFCGANEIGNLVLAVLYQIGNNIASVINDDVGAVIEGNFNVPIVGCSVFPFIGIDGNAIIRNQASGDIILGRKGVAGNQDSVSTARLESDREVSRFGGNVAAGN
jgi:hypothetical protein